MVKIVLIGKSGGLDCAQPARRIRFVELEFILYESVHVMVNRGFTRTLTDLDLSLRLMRHTEPLSMNPILSAPC
jgi:hypothetical protein